MKKLRIAKIGYIVISLAFYAAAVLSLISDHLPAQTLCILSGVTLMDPTSACNLHCTGCWAAGYGNKLNLSFDEMDSIIRQGRELGVYMYLYTGGEPLVRKADLIRLCEIAVALISLLACRRVLKEERKHL